LQTIHKMARLKAFYVLLGLLVVPVATLLPMVDGAVVRRQILTSLLLSVFGFFAALNLIPIIKEYTLRRGMKGKDLNKKGTEAGEKDVPESLGVVSGTVFLMLAMLFQVFHMIPIKALDDYNAGLTSICFMMFLGFADDVLDLPWRYKIVIPAVSTLPLLVAYDGGTSVLVPKPLRVLLGAHIEIGILYKVYMGFLAVFCSQCINIYAGVNGLEAGQSFIIACAILVHNLLQLDGEFTDQHRFSAFLILPFIAVTLALLYYNWYPSRVFVGDTYCYFAGMTFAVVGILAHFSEMLIFFFVPQILNFLYSIPQLFKIVPCPRHRIPKYNKETGKLESSKNYTLLNLALEIFGPMEEPKLVKLLLLFQVLCCSLAFLGRHLFVESLYSS